MILEHNSIFPFLEQSREPKISQTCFLCINPVSVQYPCTLYIFPQNRDKSIYTNHSVLLNF